MIDETVYLVKRARAGMSMEDFSKSDVGKLFLERAEQIEREAELEFRTVDPGDYKMVRNVQNKLVVVDMFRRFLVECIEQGKVAEKDLEVNENY